MSSAVVASPVATAARTLLAMPDAATWLDHVTCEVRWCPAAHSSVAHELDLRSGRKRHHETEGFALLPLTASAAATLANDVSGRVVDALLMVSRATLVVFDDFIVVALDPLNALTQDPKHQSVAVILSFDDIAAVDVHSDFGFNLDADAHGVEDTAQAAAPAATLSVQADLHNEWPDAPPCVVSIAVKRGELKLRLRNYPTFFTALRALRTVATLRSTSHVDENWYTRPPNAALDNVEAAMEMLDDDLVGRTEVERLLTLEYAALQRSRAVFYATQPASLKAALDGYAFVVSERVRVAGQESFLGSDRPPPAPTSIQHTIQTALLDRLFENESRACDSFSDIQDAITATRDARHAVRTQDATLNDWVGVDVGGAELESEGSSSIEADAAPPVVANSYNVEYIVVTMGANADAFLTNRRLFLRVTSVKDEDGAPYAVAHDPHAAPFVFLSAADIAMIHRPSASDLLLVVDDESDIVGGIDLSPKAAPWRSHHNGGKVLLQSIARAEQEAVLRWWLASVSAETGIDSIVSGGATHPDAGETPELVQRRQAVVRRLYHRFNRIDESRDGNIDADELDSALGCLCVCAAFSRNLFETLDRDGSGLISFREFAVGIAEMIFSTQSTKMRNALRLFDADRDGAVTATELASVFSVLASYGDILGKTEEQLLQAATAITRRVLAKRAAQRARIQRRKSVKVTRFDPAATDEVSNMTFGNMTFTEELSNMTFGDVPSAATTAPVDGTIRIEDLMAAAASDREVCEVLQDIGIELTASDVATNKWQDLVFASEAACIAYGTLDWYVASGLMQCLQLALDHCASQETAELGARRNRATTAAKEMNGASVSDDGQTPPPGNSPRPTSDQADSVPATPQPPAAEAAEPATPVQAGTTIGSADARFVERHAVNLPAKVVRAIGVPAAEAAALLDLERTELDLGPVSLPAGSGADDPACPGDETVELHVFAPRVCREMRSTFGHTTEELRNSFALRNITANMVLGTISVMQPLHAVFGAHEERFDLNDDDPLGPTRDGESAEQRHARHSAFVYRTADGNVLLRAVSADELAGIVENVLPLYDHVASEPDTLLPRYLGLYSLVVMRGEQPRHVASFVTVVNALHCASPVSCVAVVRGSVDDDISTKPDAKMFRDVARKAQAYNTSRGRGLTEKSDTVKLVDERWMLSPLSLAEDWAPVFNGQLERDANWLCSRGCAGYRVGIAFEQSFVTDLCDQRFAPDDPTPASGVTVERDAVKFGTYASDLALAGCVTAALILAKAADDVVGDSAERGSSVTRNMPRGLRPSFDQPSWWDTRVAAGGRLTSLAEGIAAKRGNRVHFMLLDVSFNRKRQVSNGVACRQRLLDFCRLTILSEEDDGTTAEDLDEADDETRLANILGAHRKAFKARRESGGRCWLVVDDLSGKVLVTRRATDYRKPLAQFDALGGGFSAVLPDGRYGIVPVQLPVPVMLRDVMRLDGSGGVLTDFTKQGIISLPNVTAQRSFFAALRALEAAKTQAASTRRGKHTISVGTHAQLYFASFDLGGQQPPVNCWTWLRGAWDPTPTDVVVVSAQDVTFVPRQDDAASRSDGATDDANKSTERASVDPIAHFIALVSAALPGYSLVQAAARGGALVAVFALPRAVHHLSAVDTATSSPGAHTNTVAVTLRYHQSTFAFVAVARPPSASLSPFLGVEDLETDLQSALVELNSRVGSPTVDLLADFHHVFIGASTFVPPRVPASLAPLHMSDADIQAQLLAYAREGKLSALDECDALRVAMDQGTALFGLTEPRRRFPPTFPFATSAVAAVASDKTSGDGTSAMIAARAYDTQRFPVPVYTARILHKATGHPMDHVGCLGYDADANIRTSPHAPVSARFRLRIRLHDPRPPMLTRPVHVGRPADVWRATHLRIRSLDAWGLRQASSTLICQPAFQLLSDVFDDTITAAETTVVVPFRTDAPSLHGDVDHEDDMIINDADDGQPAMSAARVGADPDEGAHLAVRLLPMSVNQAKDQRVHLTCFDWSRPERATALIGVLDVPMYDLPLYLLDAETAVGTRVSLPLRIDAARLSLHSRATGTLSAVIDVVAERV